MPMKTFALFLLLFLLHPNARATAKTVRPNQDHALFFANDDYKANQDFGNLRNPVSDAKAIARELREMFGFTVTIHQNKTKREIYSILQDWQRKQFGGEDQLFIFFSGHGTFSDLETKGYFVPGGPGRDFGNYIDLSSLGNIVTKIQCPHILLAIDACYSGTIDQEIAFKGTKMRRPGEAASARDELIARQLRNKTRLLITSGEKQRTPDGTDHSPFAKAILNGLKKAYVSGDNLFIWPDLLAQLERVSPRPHKGNLIGHEEGGFVFVTEDSKPAIRLGSSPEPSHDKADFAIDRDGNSYPFKTMNDGKVWLTKNLNVIVNNSYCYNGEDANCDKYGRLYTWEAAKEGCTSLGNGWRLPSDEEWRNLVVEYGGYYDDRPQNQIGYPARSSNSLLEGGDSGFSALLGGHSDRTGSYYFLDNTGLYWSATPADQDASWHYGFAKEDKWLYRFIYGSRERGFSVRCIRD